MLQIEDSAASSPRPRLLAALAVGNEAGRYLRPVLDHLAGWVDGIVVWDDASSDGSGEICRQHPAVWRVLRSSSSLFETNESLLRQRLWQAALEFRPQWVLAADADEIYESRISRQIGILLRQRDYDVIAFRLFDLWDDLDHYRVDGLWNPWPRFLPLLARVDPSASYSWPAVPIHCPRLPEELRSGRSVYHSDIRIRHLGWVRLEDRLRRYLFYRRKDIETFGRPQPHTESVIQAPVLEAWLPQPLPPDPEGLLSWPAERRKPHGKRGQGQSRDFDDQSLSPGRRTAALRRR
ncbi:MAG: glycosyltransferase family 2 protein [Firmicutes bacterium]|nr:glycosyltransferase family 2 protein [Bacillota bacterium]